MSRYDEQIAILQRLIKDRVLKNKEDGTSFTGGDGWIFDFRSVLLKQNELTLITDVLWEKLKHRDNFQIGGIESAAIPLVTSLLLKAKKEGKKVNGFYVRKSRKKSGLYKPIEGELNDDPIVLVDDLTNFAHSLLKQVAVLEKEGYTVDEALVVVRFRPLEAYTPLNERGIKITNIFTLEDFGIEAEAAPGIKWNPYPKKLLFSGGGRTGYQHVAPKSTPAIDETGIYLGTDTGRFLKLNKMTGSLVWEMQVGAHAKGKGIFSSPLLYKDLVIFGAYDGRLYALNRETGEAKWIFNDCEWIGSSPAAADDLDMIFVGLEHGRSGARGSVIALNAENGERVWEYAMPALTHASPLYIKEKQQVCIGGNEGMLRLFDAKTGELIWQFETEGGMTHSRFSGFGEGDIKLAPVYDRETDSIAFCSMDGWLYALDAKDGSLRYRIPSEKGEATYRTGIYSRPVIVGDLLLFTGLDKFVRAHNKHTGALIWEYETAGRIFATPAVVDARVFAGSNDGRLYEFDLFFGKMLAKTQFAERITNECVHDPEQNVLFVYTHTNELYKLNLS